MQRESLLPLTASLSVYYYLLFITDDYVFSLVPSETEQRWLQYGVIKRVHCVYGYGPPGSDTEAVRNRTCAVSSSVWEITCTRIALVETRHIPS